MVAQNQDCTFQASFTLVPKFWLGELSKSSQFQAESLKGRHFFPFPFLLAGEGNSEPSWMRSANTPQQDKKELELPFWAWPTYTEVSGERNFRRV